MNWWKQISTNMLNTISIHRSFSPSFVSIFSTLYLSCSSGIPMCYLTDVMILSQATKATLSAHVYKKIMMWNPNKSRSAEVSFEWVSHNKAINCLFGLNHASTPIHTIILYLYVHFAWFPFNINYFYSIDVDDDDDVNSPKLLNRTVHAMALMLT